MNSGQELILGGRGRERGWMKTCEKLVVMKQEDRSPKRFRDSNSEADV